MDPASVRALVRRCRPRLVSITWVPTNGGLIQPAAEVGAVCRGGGCAFPARCLPGGWPAVHRCRHAPVRLHAFGDGAEVPARPARDGLPVCVRRGPRARRVSLTSTCAARCGPPRTPSRCSTARGDSKSGSFPTHWCSASVPPPRVRARGRHGAHGGTRPHPGTPRRAAGRRARRSVTRSRSRGAKLSAIAAFAIDGHVAHDVMHALQARGINTSALARGGAVMDMGRKGATTALRVSPHYFNTGVGNRDVGGGVIRG